MERVLSMSCEDLRKVWVFEVFEFIGGTDGGSAEEWFQLITEKIFAQDVGLWQTIETNDGMRVDINPASETLYPSDHLTYFRFIGRVMGKAIFDRQLVNGRMLKHLYKHILSWPVMFKDLKDVDEEYYNSLKGFEGMGEDVECAYIDFTVTEDTLGMKKTVELIPGGADVDVTAENLSDYIEACLKYRLLGRYEAQLQELLLGFFDVIPEPLLTVFDHQELEWLMCGPQTLSDKKSNPCISDWESSVCQAQERKADNRSASAIGDVVTPGAQHLTTAGKTLFERKLEAEAKAGARGMGRTSEKTLYERKMTDEAGAQSVASTPRRTIYERKIEEETALRSARSTTGKSIYERKMQDEENA